MYDAYEKRESLENVMRLIERAKDEIAGMGYPILESELEDLMSSVYDEKTDLDDEIEEENRKQEEEDEREYYASCY
jgi:hypothetical protein